MKLYLSKEFNFDSAHNLIHYHGKCENLHGHTYKLKVTLSGTPDAHDGMIIDFGILKKIVEDKIISRLDHNYLNNLVPLSTAENLVQWIWDELEPCLRDDRYSLHELVLWETATSSVTLNRGC